MSSRRRSLINSGRRPSFQPPPSLRSLNTSRSSLIRNQIFRLRSSLSRGAVFTWAEEDSLPSVFDPIEEERKTEVQSPGQMYEATKGHELLCEWENLAVSMTMMFNVTSVFRFPYICSKYGGGIFIFPYLIMMVVLGFPCCYMEMLIGQFTRTGSVTSFRLVPLFKGLGICFVVMNFLSTFYNNTITLWGIFYFENTLHLKVKTQNYHWMVCNESWNSPGDCIRYDSLQRSELDPSIHDSNVEFFRGYILGQDHSNSYSMLNFAFPGIGTALRLAGISIFLCLISIPMGSKALSRFSVIIGTTIASIVWLLLIRCCSLPGSILGLEYYLTPNWSQLANYETWFEAARYVISSIGLGTGLHLTHASFNSFVTPSVVRSSLVPLISAFLYTVAFALAVFSLLGFGSVIYKRSLPKLIEFGPEFLFVDLPVVWHYYLSFPTQFYLILTFITPILTAAYGTIVRLVNLRACLLDSFTTFFCTMRLLKLLPIFLLLATISFCCTIPFASTSGLPLTAVYHTGIEGIAQPFLIFLEMIVFGWIFGPKALNHCSMAVNNHKVNMAVRILWKIVTPVTALIITILGLLRAFRMHEYDGIEVPIGVRGFGLYILILILLILSIVAGIVACRCDSAIGKLKFLVLISPDYEMPFILMERDGVRLHCAHWKAIDGIAASFVRSIDLINKSTPESYLFPSSSIMSEEDSDGNVIRQRRGHKSSQQMDTMPVLKEANSAEIGNL